MVYGNTHTRTVNDDVSGSNRSITAAYVKE